MIYENGNFAECATRATEVADLSELISWKYLINRDVSVFENRKEVLNHFTLLLELVKPWRAYDFQRSEKNIFSKRRHRKNHR